MPQFRRSIQIHRDRISGTHQDFPFLVDLGDMVGENVFFANDEEGKQRLSFVTDETYEGSYFVTVPHVSDAEDVFVWVFYEKRTLP